MSTEKLSLADHVVKIEFGLSLAEAPLEEQLIKRAEYNSRQYRDKIEKIRRDVCPRYAGVPKDVSLVDRRGICNSCSDSYCPTKE